MGSSTSKSAAVNLRASSETLPLDSSADTIPVERRFSQEYEFVDLSQDVDEAWNALEAEAEAEDLWRRKRFKKSKFVDSQASSTSDVESDSE